MSTATATTVTFTTNAAWFNMSARFDTVEDARTWAAQFPKSLGVKATTLGSWDPATGKSLTLGLAFMDAKMASDGANGGRNETGIKRALRALALCDKAGLEVTFRDQTREEFLAAVQA